MKNGFESLGRIRAQGIALLLLTFIVGVLVGFAGERVRNARRTPPPFEPGQGISRQFREGRLPRMFQALRLTPEQRDQIAVIMENGRERTDAALDELRAVTDSIHQEIRAVLTPEQLAVWDSVMVRIRMRRGPMQQMPGRRMDRGAPPPPMP